MGTMRNNESKLTEFVENTMNVTTSRNRISLRNVTLLISDWIAVAIWVAAFVAITLAAL